MLHAASITTQPLYGRHLLDITEKPHAADYRVLYRLLHLVCAHNRRPFMKPGDASILNWAITLLLIAIVGVVFTFVGTGSEMASLLGCIAAISCLVLALAMLAVYVWHHHRRSGTG